MPTLTTHFRKLLEEIQPPDDRLELAKTLPREVREFLRLHEEFITRSPHSRLAGSYAQFLTVGDVKDVDFLIRVDGDQDANDPTARSVLSGLVKALKELPENLGYVGDADFDFTRNRRSVQVKFENEEFYLDVVPCIAPTGSTNQFTSRIGVTRHGFSPIRWVSYSKSRILRESIAASSGVWLSCSSSFATTA